MNNSKETPLFKNVSFASLDARRKIVSSFALSSIIPILIAFYLSYDKVLLGSRRTSIFLFIATILSLFGFFLFNDIMKSLIKEE